MTESGRQLRLETGYLSVLDRGDVVVDGLYRSVILVDTY